MTTQTDRFGVFSARLVEEAVGDLRLAQWQVADLERHVDRQALLAGDDPPDPPYWAHVWGGARILAAAIPTGSGRAIEIGCGLGLPGLVAAMRGFRVVFCDRLREPLLFVRESLAANGSRDTATLVQTDFTTIAVRAGFDLVLAAEILYERARFAMIARTLAGLVAPGGRILLTDGLRVDTRDFYADLDHAGLRWRATEHRVVEEGLPTIVKLVEARPIRAVS